MTNIFKSLKRTPYQTLSILLVLFFSSFIVTSLLFTTLFFNAVLKQVELTPQVIIYFKPDTTENIIANLKDEIGNRFKIKSINYISQEKALEIYKKMFKDEPILIETITKDLLPPSLEIKVKDPTELYKVAEFAKKQKGVDEVDFQEDIVNKLLNITRNLRKFSIIAGIAIFLFTLIILISVISFKVSLKKEEIELLKLLGANNFFIFKPFISENIFLAILSSIFAFIFVNTISLYLKPFINVLFFQGEKLKIEFLSYTLTIWPINQNFMLILLMFSLIFSILVSILATIISANKYIK